MKKITVSAKKHEFDELEIIDENISLKELDEKLLIRRIKKTAERMQMIANNDEGRVMTEEEIFRMVRDIDTKD